MYVDVDSHRSLKYHDTRMPSRSLPVSSIARQMTDCLSDISRILNIFSIVQNKDGFTF